MNDLSQLKPKLVRLKLSGVLETLEQRIAQAMEEKMGILPVPLESAHR
jgi:hypothetical protein